MTSDQGDCIRDDRSHAWGQYIITGIMAIYKNCNNLQCEFHMILMTDTTTNDNCNDYTKTMIIIIIMIILL